MTKRWSDEQVDRVLRYDALHEAELLTGDSCHTSKTGFIGMALMSRSVEAKQKMLRDNGDVAMGMKLLEYVAVIERNGFYKVGEWPFSSFLEGSQDEAKEESYLVYFRHPGQLLAFDTFWGRETVNSGKVYYNVRRTSKDQWDSLHPTSSGHWASSDPLLNWDEARLRDSLIWSGDHDCREALIHNMARLAHCGEFVEPWADVPHVWLTHHMDRRTEAGAHRSPLDFSWYYEVSYERAMTFPPEVQKAISLDKWKRQ